MTSKATIHPTAQAILAASEEAQSREEAIERWAAAIVRWVDRICAENPERAREFDEIMYGSRRAAGEDVGQDREVGAHPNTLEGR